MKQFILLLSVLSVSMIDFSGCRKNDDNPIGPDTTAAGKSFVAGYVALSCYVNNMGVQRYKGTLDLSGAKIEVINKPIKTFTDVMGYWQLPNLDSGVYTMLITKNGFDTVIIENLVVKNNDSLLLGKTPTRWNRYVLNEIITGTIVHPTAQFKTLVDTIIREHGVKVDTNGFKMDTTYKYEYRLSGSFEVQFSGAETNIFYKNPYYPYDVCCTINSSPTMDMSKYPLIAYDLLQKLTNYPERIWDATINGDTNKRSLSGKYTLTDLRFSPSTQERSLLPKQQLYLHIVPVYLQWHHEGIHSGVVEGYKRGQVVSIPIQLK